jgi:hypothetical protein
MEHYPRSLKIDQAMVAFRTALADLFPNEVHAVLYQIDTQIDHMLKNTELLVGGVPSQNTPTEHAVHKLTEAAEILKKGGLDALKHSHLHSHNNLIESAHYWCRQYGALD